MLSGQKRSLGGTTSSSSSKKSATDMHYILHVVFDFSQGQEWTMKSACGNPSTNPAPANFNEVIYIIHNIKTNGIYVGYAQDVRQRWEGRTEVFHCFNILEPVGETILCAACKPYLTLREIRLSDVPEYKLKTTHDAFINKLDNLHSPEHLLLQFVLAGGLGIVTNTNTKLLAPFSLDSFKQNCGVDNYLSSFAPIKINTKYINFNQTRVLVYLPDSSRTGTGTWGNLPSGKWKTIEEIVKDALLSPIVKKRSLP